MLNWKKTHWKTVMYIYTHTSSDFSTAITSKYPIVRKGDFPVPNRQLAKLLSGFVTGQIAVAKVVFTVAAQSLAWGKWLLITKTIGNRKRDCAWGCAGVKKLKKNQLLSTNHQNPNLLRLVMICAQQLIFLQFFNTRASSRTISFSISNSFCY